MSSPQDKGNNSDRSKAITCTNIEPCAYQKKRQPTFAENWEVVSEERIIKLVNSTKSKTKPPLVSSIGSSPNQAVVSVLSTAKLSEDCGHDTLNSEKELGANEVANHASSSSTQSGYNGRFSFYERHQNWMSQTRRRVNGRYDKFYYHRTANWIFRSKIEVTNFVLYETYPRRLQKQKEITNEEMLSQSFEDWQRESPSKRKRAPTPDGVLARSVEQFLAEAYRNLMNLGKTTAPSSGAKGNSNAEEANCCTPGSQEHVEGVPQGQATMGSDSRHLLNKKEEPQEQEGANQSGNNENAKDDAQKRGVSRIPDPVAASEGLAMENLGEDFTQMPLDQDFDSLFKCVYTYI